MWLHLRLLTLMAEASTVVNESFRFCSPYPGASLYTP